MAVGILAAGGVGPGGSYTLYTVPGGISYAVVHVYPSNANVNANGATLGGSASLVLSTGQTVGISSFVGPNSFAPGGSAIVTGYEVP